MLRSSPHRHPPALPLLLFSPFVRAPYEPSLPLARGAQGVRQLRKHHGPPHTSPASLVSRISHMICLPAVLAPTQSPSLAAARPMVVSVQTTSSSAISWVKDPIPPCASCLSGDPPRADRLADMRHITGHAWHTPCNKTRICD